MCVSQQIAFFNRLFSLRNLAGNNVMQMLKAPTIGISTNILLSRDRDSFSALFFSKEQICKVKNTAQSLMGAQRAPAVKL